MNRIDEIREREARATAGPWRAEEDMILTDSPPDVVMKPFYDDDTETVSVCMFKNDEEFIVNSREDIPYLLDEITRLQSEVERLQNHIDELNNNLDCLTNENAQLYNALEGLHLEADTMEPPKEETK